MDVRKKRSSDGKSSHTFGVSTLLGCCIWRNIWGEMSPLNGIARTSSRITARFFIVWTLFILAIGAQAQLGTSAWPKFHANQTNTGVGIGQGASSAILWSFTNPGFAAFASSVALGTVGPNGLAYVGGTDGAVYAIDLKTGKQKWVFSKEWLL